MGWLNLPIHKKISQKLVTASTGKTNQKLQEAAIVKTQTQIITHSRSHSLAKASKYSVSTRSSSAHKMAASSEVSGNARTGNMPVASRSPHSKSRSGKKVTSYKSAGTVAHFPSPVTKQTGVDSSSAAASCTIWKPAHFCEVDKQVPDHLLGSSGPGDHGHSVPQDVLHRHVWIRSPTPSVSGDSDLDMDATNNSAGHSLLEDIGSPPTPCVSQGTSPVPAHNMVVDDSLVELEVSQDELEALDNDSISISSPWRPHTK